MQEIRNSQGISSLQGLGKILSSLLFWFCWSELETLGEVIRFPPSPCAPSYLFVPGKRFKFTAYFKSRIRDCNIFFSRAHSSKVFFKAFMQESSFHT